MKDSMNPDWIMAESIIINLITPNPFIGSFFRSVYEPSAIRCTFCLLTAVCFCETHAVACLLASIHLLAMYLSSGIFWRSFILHNNLHYLHALFIGKLSPSMKWSSSHCPQQKPAVAAISPLTSLASSCPTSSFTGVLGSVPYPLSSMDTKPALASMFWLLTHTWLVKMYVIWTRTVFTKMLLKAWYSISRTKVDIWWYVKHGKRYK